MQQLSNRRWTAPLAYRIDDDASAARIAEALAALWHDLEGALSPIVGQRGVAALFERSAQLALAADASGVAGADRRDPVKGPAALCALVAQLDDSQAGALASGFLRAFHALLASLIGPTLTERLLRAAWGPPTGDAPSQELP